jgi:hypothetical protein
MGRPIQCYNRNGLPTYNKRQGLQKTKNLTIEEVLSPLRIPFDITYYKKKCYKLRTNGNV